MTRQVHPIERRSYEILRGRIDTTGLPRWSRAVVERVIHASGDLGWSSDLVCDEDALAAGGEALRRGVPIVCDVEMVAAGITSRPAICRIGDPAVTSQPTRAASAVRLAATEAGAGAVWVIGCAPTALTQLLAMDISPALVIGLPVGFVGAVESKAALRASGLPALTNRSEKGGAGAAAAALNALLYVEEDC